MSAPGRRGRWPATILARAGARVRIVDRATFPRDKLCGDTVNPGHARAPARARPGGGDRRARPARRRHARHRRARRRDRGALSAADCPAARSLRRELDWLLLQQAIAAGCRVRSGRRGPRRDRRRTRRACASVSGVAIGVGRPRDADRRARRRSPRTAATRRSRSVSASPRTRRARGAGPSAPTSRISQRSDGLTALGEMHVRRGHYIGVAPVPRRADQRVPGETVVCRRRGARRSRRRCWRARSPPIRCCAIASAGARLVGTPVVLGPLAVDVRAAPIDGLLLAGDAAGFIDPMTGDGLRFATHGAELAAAAALRALEHGWAGVHGSLAAARRRAFSTKWTFNRGLRALVASPAGVEAAAVGARIAPSMLRAAIARAGDC